MKNRILSLGLLVLMGGASMASAGQIVTYAPRPVVQASITLPGMRLVLGRPNVYCWYQGRTYSRVAWEKFYRLHRERVAFYRHGRDYDRNHRTFDRDRDHDRF
ncbi:MAG TPA: hypothetical protein VHE12_06445 [bacterium]|nr:hypothetical protein [bacterium]